MPATLANTFILQGSVLADLRHDVFCLCNSERIIKIGQYLLKLRSNKKGLVFWLTVYTLKRH